MTQGLTFAVVVAHPDDDAYGWSGSVALHADDHGFRFVLIHMRGVPDEQIGLVVDCRQVADRIVAGLMQHESQHHVMYDYPVDPERWKRIVTRDWSVVAWPPREPGEPHLTDMFEGLP